MRPDRDHVVLVIAAFGLLMALGSVWNAVLEMRECGRSGVNGATHFSANALAIKAVLMVIAQFALMILHVRYAEDPAIETPPELVVVVCALTAKVTYDFFFHLRLYAMVKPSQGSPKRRSTD